MHPWFRWFAYIDPVSYAFESLMNNEFSDRQFPCSMLVPEGPDYAQADAGTKACTVVSAGANPRLIDGNLSLADNFHYSSQHLWRNLRVLIVFAIFLCALNLVGTETISSEQQGGNCRLSPRRKCGDFSIRDEEKGQGTTSREGEAKSQIHVALPKYESQPSMLA